MINPDQVPAVADNELLARYATQRSQFRPDGTAKRDLFSPHPRRELSVTRHRDATESEVWESGRQVAAGLGRTLYGRADLGAGAVREVVPLVVHARPIASNPNHADICGWPAAKEDKIALAQELAARASKLVPPPAGSLS